MPKVLVLSRDIAASPETVWRIVTDIDGSPHRMRGIRKIERIDGPDGRRVPGYGVGTTWRETRRMFGQEASEDMTVTAVDEGRSTTIEAESNGIHYVTAFHVAPSHTGGTTLTFEFSGRPVKPKSIASSIMLNLMGSIGLAATKKAVLGDLDDIKRAAEADASAAS